MELGRAARDVVDVVWWSRWSELGGAARDVVDVVRGRRGLTRLAQRLAFFLVDVYTYIQATYVVSFAWLP